MPPITIILFGILAACFALALELLVTGISSVSLIGLATLSWKTLSLLAGIAIIEEASKYIFLRQYVSRFGLPAGEGPHLAKAALLGTAFGAGFVVPELFLLYSGAAPVPLLPVVTLISVHILTSLAFAAALFASRDRKRWVFFSLAFAVFLHLSYNAALVALP